MFVAARVPVRDDLPFEFERGAETAKFRLVFNEERFDEALA